MGLFTKNDIFHFVGFARINLLSSSYKCINQVHDGGVLMKEFKQVGEIQSLGNQELILAKSNLKQGYFYKIKKRAQSQQSQTHYVLIIDGSKSSKQHFHDIKKL